MSGNNHRKQSEGDSPVPNDSQRKGQWTGMQRRSLQGSDGIQARWLSKYKSHHHENKPQLEADSQTLEYQERTTSRLLASMSQSAHPWTWIHRNMIPLSQGLFLRQTVLQNHQKRLGGIQVLLQQWTFLLKMDIFKEIKALKFHRKQWRLSAGI